MSLYAYDFFGDYFNSYLLFLIKSKSFNAHTFQLNDITAQGWLR